MNNTHAETVYRSSRHGRLPAGNSTHVESVYTVYPACREDYMSGTILLLKQSIDPACRTYYVRIDYVGNSTRVETFYISSM